MMQLHNGTVANPFKTHGSFTRLNDFLFVFFFCYDISSLEILHISFLQCRVWFLILIL
jgi:hypothetical protein